MIAKNRKISQQSQHKIHIWQKENQTKRTFNPKSCQTHQITFLQISLEQETRKYFLVNVFSNISFTVQWIYRFNLNISRVTQFWTTYESKQIYWFLRAIYFKLVVNWVECSRDRRYGWELILEILKDSRFSIPFDIFNNPHLNSDKNRHNSLKIQFFAIQQNKKTSKL